MYVQGNQASLADYESQLGLPNDFSQIGFPSIGSNLTMPYGGSQWYYGMSQILSTLDENLSKPWGKHQLTFGGRYRHERFGYLSDRSPDSVNFSNLGTAEYDPTTGANYSAKPNTGYADADFFLGLADSYTENKNAPFNHVREQEFDSYIQDNYRVKPNLTLNLGVRWEAHPAPHADKSYFTTFSLKDDALVLPQPLSYYIQQGLTTQALVTNLQNLGVKFETPQQAGIPSAGFNGTWGNFLPRMGFAWTPSFGHKGTVIRGAFGEFVYPVPIRNSVRYLTADYPFTASYSQSYTSAAYSPDGLPNYILRAPQTVVAGQNSANVVNTNSVNALLPGISLGETLASNYPPAKVQEANMTIEQPIKDGSVFRVSYVFTHGYNLDQNYQYNNAPSTYAWETATGTTPPTGTYAGVATRPYDNLTWGGNVISVKDGWSNDSALQLNYQRPFKNGFAYQVFYVYSRAFRVGGNTFRDSTIYPAADFAPGVLPSGLDTGTILNPSHALDRYENYHVDTAIPEHHLTFNGVVDIPVGKGKHFLPTASRWVDALLGGYQVAFVGQIISQSFQVAAANWGSSSPLQVYGSSDPITDCRSGVCHPEYLWFNGYISPPSSARPRTESRASRQIIRRISLRSTTRPEPRISATTTCTVTLKNGTQVVTAYSPGPAGANLFSQTILLGPFNYNADISLYKVFSFSERVKLRINVDAFNAFNIQGRVNPNTTDGTESLQTSYWTPRQIQITARFSF